MTGYGKAIKKIDDKKITVEIKSLNSKSIDISTRISSIYREKELEIRRIVSQRLERGKIEVNISCERDEKKRSPLLNKEVIQSYWEQMQQIGETLPHFPKPSSEHLWEILLSLPEVTKTTTVEDLTEEECEVLLETTEEAIAQLMAFRQQEGEALSHKLLKNLEAIEFLMTELEPYEKHRVEKIRLRLEERLAELTGIDYDKNRLEQELIYYIEKFDINEEKQRLANHIAYFRETMNQEKGQGKKLGFIAQEMGREINTTGSKSNQAEMQNIVVKMKDELEQIKEQVLNLM